MVFETQSTENDPKTTEEKVEPTTEMDEGLDKLIKKQLKREKQKEKEAMQRNEEEAKAERDLDKALDDANKPKADNKPRTGELKVSDFEEERADLGTYLDRKSYGIEGDGQKQKRSGELSADDF